MFIDSLLATFNEFQSDTAIIWKDKAFSYQWLISRVNEWLNILFTNDIQAGTIVNLEADFSPASVALLLALTEQGCIIVPFAGTNGISRQQLKDVAEGEVDIQILQNDEFIILKTKKKSIHPLYQQLRATGHPGLVLFSSGSTGVSKAALHDIVRLTKKFEVKRQRLNVLSFLLFDHIGGLNTLLYTLSNGGTLITISERNPDAVLSLIERYRVELLPTSPTFINLILLSEAYKRHNLSSLKTITYGTEVMPEQVLKKFNQLLPHISMQQTYGLSELGILRSKSEKSDSLWVKLGGEGFEIRIVNGILQIKAESAMLGYLNAPNPFTDDGWFDTGDEAEVNGEYIKILGRKSDIINVGGEKVYPAEVESVILELEDVLEVVVFGEKNPIVSNIVCVKIYPRSDSDPSELIKRIKDHCRSRLQNFKVPVKILISTEPLHTARFKKTSVIFLI